MELVARSVFVYFFLLLVFAIAGKRQLAQVDTFRFVLLLIISEATQQALVDDNHSLTGAAIVITALVSLEILMSTLKCRFPLLDKMSSGGPLILVDQGKPLEDRMRKESVNDEDILSAARIAHGLETMSEIKYAVLEESGEITIIPAGKDRVPL